MQHSKLHFIGIGGAGMSAIASMCLHAGHRVTGSDVCESDALRQVRFQGATVYLHHDPQWVAGVDTIVVTSAIHPNNPELLAAKASGVEVLHRSEMLARLAMQYNNTVAIAGSHGKTTVTALLSYVAKASKLDPSYVIGGKISGDASHAHAGGQNLLLFEADESDGSFLAFAPSVAVITNMDADHMAVYDHDIEKLKAAFLKFAHNTPEDGMVVLGIDDENVRAIMPAINRKIITYGLTQDADIRAENSKPLLWQSQFEVNGKMITLNMPGRCNIQNALAVLAVEAALQVDFDKQAFEAFPGVARRCVRHNVTIGTSPVTLIEDYGHHPAEIKAMLELVREHCPGQRVVMLFQPHRYSRTKTLLQDFAAVLSGVDVLLISDIYAAFEAPIIGVNSQLLINAIQAEGAPEPIYVDALEHAPDLLAQWVQPNDVVLIQGAGTVSRVVQRLL
jgi:UDP-N-acetylmuramate--alanine ligase